tara:strand:- start:4 stop:492 length:489 start_codon:yes stop_codon:yes gene_type:complete
MKTLIEAVEKWIDDKITDNIAVDRADRMSHSATVDVQELNAKLNAMEEIHIRDANRIADLERRVQLYLDSPSPESDGEESTVTELSMRIDDVDSRLDDLECSMEEKVDSCDLDDMIDSAMSDSDLPDSYSVEVMIDDALETKVMDAVKAELDATDFKITVER